MLGVEMAGKPADARAFWPVTPKSPMPKSSASSTIMLGLVAAVEEFLGPMDAQSAQKNSLR
jgi:hypothetical protein